MSLSADVLLSQFYFPPRLLHCTCSSLLVVTPPSSSQKRPSSKRRNQGVSLASILEPLCLVPNLAISSEYYLKNVLEQQCTPFSTKKISWLAVSHHKFTIFLLHCHQRTKNCWMIIYLSRITPRHLSIHRLLLPSHTRMQPTTINRWNSTQRAVTKSTMLTCLPFQMRNGIWILQLQCQAANISTSTNSITSTQTLSTTRVTSPKRFRRYP